VSQPLLSDECPSPTMQTAWQAACLIWQ